LNRCENFPQETRHGVLGDSGGPDSASERLREFRFSDEPAGRKADELLASATIAAIWGLREPG